ncbi:hypothetical protein [Humibacter sp. RRB41]|uniref:hypothetical protein n=1 Tax=Humibacter sp. RRB41 TaxID=2919946 RepID=UPI001FAA1F0E|nr:hypothetical protein [Humibacter sp. RRB41]
MSREERGVLTVRVVWWSVFVASLAGMLVSAVLGLWLLTVCVAVALGCLVIAIGVRLLMEDDDADD